MFYSLLQYTLYNHVVLCYLRHVHMLPPPCSGYASYAKETIIACLSKYKEKKATVIAVLSDCLDAVVDTVCLIPSFFKWCVL